MGPETVRFYQEPQETDEAKQIFEMQQERLRRLSEPESPATTLGNMVLSSVIGGALTGGAVMPRTEAVTLELIAGTSEYADSLDQSQKRAA